jgi:hypothetical protein
LKIEDRKLKICGGSSKSQKINMLKIAAITIKIKTNKKKEA